MTLESTVEMTREQLLAQIDASFELAPRPDPERLLKPHLVGMAEADELKKSFAPLDWQSVPPQLLRTGEAAPTYFSDEAFIYYLPAYLKLIATDIEYADVLVDIVIEKLVLPANEDVLKEFVAFAKDKDRPKILQEYFSNKLAKLDERLHGFIKTFALLSCEQSRCVLHFLEYMQEHYAGYFNEDILRRAIYRYWFVFGSSGTSTP